MKCEPNCPKVQQTFCTTCLGFWKFQWALITQSHFRVTVVYRWGNFQLRAWRCVGWTDPDVCHWGRCGSGELDATSVLFLNVPSRKGFCFINFIDFGYYIRNCEHLYWFFVYTCIYTVCIDCVYIQWVPVILLQMCTLSFDWRTICWSKSLIGRPILSTLRDLKHSMLKLRASWVYEGVWLMGVKTRTETGWLEGWWKANVVF